MFAQKTIYILQLHLQGGHYNNGANDLKGKAVEGDVCGRVEWGVGLKPGTYSWEFKRQHACAGWCAFPERPEMVILLLYVAGIKGLESSGKD